MATQQERKAATIAAVQRAGRYLFARRGFEQSTIDDIARRAGVTKGGVYHHYSSKDEIFVEVLEALQGELAERVKQAASGGRNAIEAIELGVRQFLVDCTRPDVRRILLIDGPTVLGWKRWREIDARHFGALLRQSICALRGVRELAPRDEAFVHLLLGACTEAALVSSTAQNAAESASTLAEAFNQLLSGVRS